MIIDGVTKADGTLVDGIVEAADLDTAASKGIAAAWVSFNGQNGAIYAGHNVTNVTRLEQGAYSITFTTPMSSGDYCWSGNVRRENDAAGYGIMITARNSDTKNTTTLVIRTVYAQAAAQIDSTEVNLVVFQ